MTDFPIALQQYQSLWAMEDLPYGSGASWTLAQRVHAVAEAGFDGIAIDLGARQAPTAQEVHPLLSTYSLASAVFAVAKNDADFATIMHYAQTIGAGQIVLCCQLYGIKESEIYATLARWYMLAADHGINVELETHRNTITNDLRYTVHLMEELDPRIRLAVDLSHYICAEEFPDTPDPAMEHYISRILDRAGSLQGRIANRCHVQIPLGYAQHRFWEKRFRAWWVQGFEKILHHAASCNIASVIFCTELGPHPYAWTDEHNREISDRWAETHIIRQWAKQAYALAQEKSVHDTEKTMIKVPPILSEVQ